MSAGNSSPLSSDYEEIYLRSRKEMKNIIRQQHSRTHAQTEIKRIFNNAGDRVSEKYVAKSMKNGSNIKTHKDRNTTVLSSCVNPLAHLQRRRMPCPKSGCKHFTVVYFVETILGNSIPEIYCETASHRKTLDSELVNFHGHIFLRWGLVKFLDELKDVCGAGSNYKFNDRSIGVTDIIHIGKTLVEETYQQRLSHYVDCKIGYEPVYKKHVVNIDTIERLVHFSLSNYKLPVTCDIHKSTHREVFQTTAMDQAKALINMFNGYLSRWYSPIITTLPPELLSYIAKFLRKKNLSKLIQTCSHMHYHLRKCLWQSIEIQNMKDCPLECFGYVRDVKFTGIVKKSQIVLLQQCIGLREISILQELLSRNVWKHFMWEMENIVLDKIDILRIPEFTDANKRNSLLKHFRKDI
ncbi:hypothetical protein HK096_009105, partial [Nowakowskiella sp. JEL0078]